MVTANHFMRILQAIEPWARAGLVAGAARRRGRARGARVSLAPSARTGTCATRMYCMREGGADAR
jgi:hypothetical protein